MGIPKKKKEAALNDLNNGMAQAAVAEKHGISRKTLYRWNKKQQKQEVKKPKEVAERSKNMEVGNAVLAGMDIQSDYEKLYDEALKKIKSLEAQIDELRNAKDEQIAKLKKEIEREKQRTFDDFQSEIRSSLKCLQDGIDEIKAGVSGVSSVTSIASKKETLKILGWTIHHSNNDEKYRAYARINGTKRAVYIGAKYSDALAAGKIRGAVEKNAEKWGLSESQKADLLSGKHGNTNNDKELKPVETPQEVLDFPEKAPQETEKKKPPAPSKAVLEKAAAIEAALKDKKKKAAPEISESRKKKMQEKARATLFIQAASEQFADELKPLLAACGYSADSADENGRQIFTGPDGDSLQIIPGKNEATIAHLRKHADPKAGRYQAIITNPETFAGRVNEVREALAEDFIFRIIKRPGNDYITLDKLGKMTEKAGFSLSEFHAALGRIQQSYRGQLIKGNPDLYESPETLKKYSYTDKKGEKYLNLKADFRWLEG